MDGADEDTSLPAGCLRTSIQTFTLNVFDVLEREFRRLLDEKLGRKYLELDDALFRVMDDIAEAMYMKGAADRELMIR